MKVRAGGETTLKNIKRLVDEQLKSFLPYLVLLTEGDGWGAVLSANGYENIGLAWALFHEVNGEAIDDQTQFIIQHLFPAPDVFLTNCRYLVAKTLNCTRLASFFTVFLHQWAKATIPGFKNLSSISSSKAYRCLTTQDEKGEFVKEALKHIFPADFKSPEGMKWTGNKQGFLMAPYLFLEYSNFVKSLKTKKDCSSRTVPILIQLK